MKNENDALLLGTYINHNKENTIVKNSCDNFKNNIDKKIEIANRASFDDQFIDWQFKTTMFSADLTLSQ